LGSTIITMETASKEVTSESYRPSEIIFKEGDAGSHFYIVDEGQVEIFTTQEGRELIVAKLGPGESFGEFAMLDNAPRSASARALTELSVYRVSAQGFQELLNDIPDWAGFMLKSFARRLKGMNAAFRDLRNLP
jgi:CRP/FNR family transcriptional regulator, cyclic AMP receptor protein